LAPPARDRLTTRATATRSCRQRHLSSSDQLHQLLGLQAGILGDAGLLAARLAEALTGNGVIPPT